MLSSSTCSMSTSNVRSALTDRWKYYIPLWIVKKIPESGLYPLKNSMAFSALVIADSLNPDWAIAKKGTKNRMLMT